MLSELLNGPRAIGLKQSQRAVKEGKALGAWVARKMPNPMSSGLSLRCASSTACRCIPWLPWGSWGRPAASTWAPP